MFFSSFSFTEAEEDKSVCTTDSGAAPNLPCIFPFKFNGAVHTSCIWDMAHLTEHKAWCSTLVDDTGHHVGGQGKWGNCGPGCPIPPDNRNDTSPGSGTVKVPLPGKTYFLITTYIKYYFLKCSSVVASPARKFCKNLQIIFLKSKKFLK